METRLQFLLILISQIAVNFRVYGRLKRDSDLANVFARENFSWVDVVTTNHNSSFYNYSGFNSYQPIASELYRLAEKHKFVEIEEFGHTYENRSLLALHINKKNSTDIVFINSLIHAREWIVGCVTMNIIHQLLESKSNKVTMLLDRFHFVIVPVVNPDGYEYTHTTNRMWRKNREPTNSPDCVGVDVNRNFVYGFNTYRSSGGESEVPCNEGYRGVKALSTREATGMNFLFFKYRHQMRYFIDYHSYGNFWTSPYGAHNWLPKNEFQLGKYRENAVQSLKDSGADFSSGSVFHTIYKCNGIVVDHVHYYITPIAFTVEVGDEEDDFNPKDTEIDRYVTAQWEALLSQLILLKTDLENGQYFKDKTKNWRRTSMRNK